LRWSCRTRSIATGSWLELFPDGDWNVELAPLTEPAHVVPTIALTLGVRETGGQPLHEALGAFLAAKRTLLVLDNFEHLVEAAPLVSRQLQAAPGVSMLVTSRDALRLHGEREVAVAPLAVAEFDRRVLHTDVAQNEAMRLFVQRAQAAKVNFALIDTLWNGCKVGSEVQPATLSGRAVCIARCGLWT
jgi:predicted ATPase